MSKKRGFFRGYRHGNRSMPKLLGARDTESTPSDSKSMLEIALDKANTAVLYDQADDFDAAIRSYKEAVGLLEGFFDTAGTEDRTRLQKIYESYTERIQTLSEQIATTATESSNSTISSSDQSSMLHTLAEGTTSWRTPKKKMVFDDAASTHTTDSSKTTMGGFVSMLAKRSQTKLHQIPAAFNVDPKPSKSTPISSTSRPSKTWLPLSGAKKKRHSSEYAKEKSVTPQQQEMIPPPELPVIAPVTDSDDYFDLRSTGAADLLLPTSRYSFLKDPVIKSTSSSPPRPSASISATPVTNAKHPPSTKNKNNDIQSAKAMEDAMDNLAKVLEESSLAFTIEEEEQQQQDEEVTVATGQEKTEARLLQHQQQDRRTATFSPFWRSSPTSAGGKNNKPTLTLQRRSTRIRSNSNASSTSSSTAASSPPTSPPSRWASFEQARAFSSLALSPKDQQQQRPLSTFTTTSSIVNTSSSLDSAPFMNQPPAIVSPVTIHLSLMQRLSRSMVEGAYLTERLYVPKELWYQPNIRLPALDAKLAACELLIAGLERLALLDDVTDIPLAQKELCLLEQSLDHIRDTFARKIGIMQHDDDGNNQTSSNTTNNNNNNSHSIPSSPSSSTSITATKSSKSSWSNKLSKSVERMKLESSRTLDHQYIQTLINLLSSTQILDAWHTQYSEILRCEPSEDHYLPLLVKVEAVTETMQKIVCGFILRDFSILFNKWSKRSRQWLID
ncbi:predicted protein [Lichtheimia corymbifera JMRC:FSU:9682]|uniref:MIT domain-containing protein n=1 Tax=Lichtheimia corymbifera JMRC:FSU:9682 TaxID=1263082 RepID=A0A068S9F7_9FUNG|nr:predicted protein [Lichtheimia corymbifera JMRC:FSU:9682]